METDAVTRLAMAIVRTIKDDLECQQEQRKRIQRIVRGMGYESPMAAALDAIENPSRTLLLAVILLAQEYGAPACDIDEACQLLRRLADETLKARYSARARAQIIRKEQPDIARVHRRAKVCVRLVKEDEDEDGNAGLPDVRGRDPVSGDRVPMRPGDRLEGSPRQQEASVPAHRRAGEAAGAGIRIPGGAREVGKA